MHRVLHAVTLRIILLGAFCICLTGLVPSILAQARLDGDLTQPETLQSLRPVAGFARMFFFFLAGALLLLGGVLTALRYRVGPSLYKAASDAHWTADAQADVGEKIDATEVLGACAVLEHGDQPIEEAAPPPKTEPQQHHGRLFTPASGTPWSESML